MKLPFRVHYDYFGQVRVIGADGRVVLSLIENADSRKTARAIVKNMNRDWRWRVFGLQYCEYTREDWLFERNVDLVR